MRIESDSVEILSGLRFGKTLGGPITLVIRNADWKNWQDRMAIEESTRQHEKITVPRPGHADLVGLVKYGFDDIRNVIERASARETAIRVACGSVARKLLEDVGIFIGSHVLSIGRAEITDFSKIIKRINKYFSASCGAYKVTEEADKSGMRFLDPTVAQKAQKEIRLAKKKGDTVGGVFEVLVTGCPIGLGSYVEYDRKLDAQLALSLMSIQAVKGVEIGPAFDNARRPGSQVHDGLFFSVDGQIYRKTNRAGGIEGGVSNGQTLVMRAAMKPISTLARPLPSVDLAKNKLVKARYERSDICAVPACSVVAEAVIAPVIANAFLEKFGGDSMQEIRKRYRKSTKNRRFFVI
jgi:chorismate synthase